MTSLVDMEREKASESPSSSTSSTIQKKSKPLFKEEWSKIYLGELVIKSFYFPTAAKKRIATSTIKGIYYRKQDFIPTIGDVEHWGMKTSPCWWACDFQRKWRVNAPDADRKGTAYYNVVVDCGESTMKGFTTANLRELRSVLRKECRPDLVVKEGFP
ncbi:hypothetical protein PRIPAC_70064, partial [Pristionchus pacificus]|uniref:Uncharacterized protein n=1 Tax=Pristionchus pacificus TaxID=54126 RepID=A0A2A6C078_PRIPA